jgi:hypothetical protein
MTERRMADIRAKVEIGVEPKSSLDELMLRYEKDKARYTQLLLERQASQTLSQQTLKSIQAEMMLVQQQIATIQKQVETGRLSPADPTLLQLQRELLTLQRKADELSASIRR